MVKVTLYKVHQKILEGNAIFSGTAIDRNAYLDSCVKETLTTNLSPAWIKNIENITNTLTIKLEGRTPLLEYNYMKITVNEFDHLYIITGYTELGANQVRYDLRKDTLNTYAARSDLGVNYTSSLGLVLREHKERFSSRFNTDLTPNYDRFIEDFTYDNKEYNALHSITPNRTRLLLKQYGGGINQEGTLLSKPMFLWEAYSDTRPQSNTIVKANLESGWGFRTANYGFIIRYGNDSLTFSNGHNLFSDPDLFCKINIQESNNTILVTVTKPNQTQLIDLSSGVGTGEWSLSGTYTWHIERGNNPKKLTVETISGVQEIELFFDVGQGSNPQEAFIQSLPKINSSGAFNKLDDINLYDENITKVIELPYNISHPEYRRFYPALTELQLDEVLNVPDQPLTFNFDTNFKTLRKYNMDPKLYTSQFNPLFITFSGETILIKRELLNGLDDYVYFNHKLNVGDYSKIAVSIDDDGYDYEEVYQFDKVFDLNNEVTTIGSDLKSYLNNMYSNDLKLMQMQDAQANRNLQKQAIGIGTNAALGAGAGLLTGNPIGAVAGAAVGVIKGGVNFAYSVKQAKHDRKVRQIDYENKLINLQTSLINIVGGTPEMKHINDADAWKVFEIKPVDIERKFIEDNFYYYGYSTLEISNNHFKKRTIFNYKQIIFKDLQTTRNLTIEVKNDIMNKFSEGVTIYDHLGAWGMFTEHYDFEQKYENWEWEVIY